MNQTLKFFLVAIAILLGPILFWLFGPMLFWPLSLAYLPEGDARIAYFQLIFLANLLLVIGSTLILGFLLLIGVQFSMGLFAIPYSIGVFFLISAIAIFFVRAPDRQ